MKTRFLLYLLLCLCSISASASSSLDDCRGLSIYQIMTASFQRAETGVPGFTDLWGPEGNRTDGNLKGVTASLDYIKSMGFNAIWMTPIFDTTNGKGGEKLQATGYFATDYFNIDPRFGTKDDFRELVDEAHKRGIHVILDLVAGHHGDNPLPSPEGNRIETKEDTPNDLNFLFGNIVYPGSLPFFKEVIRYWMDEFGVDGWRLDQCYQVCQGGHNYWKDLREEAEKVAAGRKARGEEWGTLAYMVGEDWNEPENIITTHNDGLRSVFDFERQNHLRWLDEGVDGIVKAYSDPVLRNYDEGVMPNLFVDNHDMGRMGSYDSDVEKLLFRYAVLAAYTGPVTFYYGDEFALKDGNGNDDNKGRVSGRLSAETEQEEWLRSKTEILFNIRASHPAMWRGECQFVKDGNTLQVIKTDRQTGDRIVVVFPMETKAMDFPADAINLLTGEKCGSDVKAFEPVIYELPAVDVSEFAAEQKASPGVVERHYVYSPQLQDTYAVDVWVPAGYDAGRTIPYQVVYAQDGQNLFDPDVTWNHQSWNVDGVAERLGDSLNDFVVVGIHNRSTRSADYLPHKPLEADAALEKKILDGWGQTESRSDRYLDFIVSTVKPMMEAEYNIRKDVSGVTAMGSSMGGLISLYAMCEYPDLFGNAICMSTHWLGYDYTCVPAFPEAMATYLEKALPTDGRHRLYLDHGTKGFDGSYEPWDTNVYELALRKGYREDETVKHHIAEGADHNETCWSQRLDIPLLFMFGSGQPLPEPDKVSVWMQYEGADADDSFYCFVYDGSSVNGGWPGVKMGFRTDVIVNGISGNWFEYKVPETLALSGLAMVTDNGSRRYPADMQPGIPLDGHSIAFIYKGGTWTTAPVESVGSTSGVDVIGEDVWSSTMDDFETEIFSLAGIPVGKSMSELSAGLYLVRTPKGFAKVLKSN